MNSNRRPSLPALAWQIADLLAAGAEELRMAADPVPVADRLLVVAMAACRDLRAARPPWREVLPAGKEQTR